MRRVVRTPFIVAVLVGVVVGVLTACPPDADAERCNSDSDCSVLTPRCEEGRCIAEDACDGARHDGGDGACVPSGQCSAGYGFFFVDADRDGVGAGPREGVCRADPPPGGFSARDDDCDDADAAAFVVRELFADEDGDGFTLGDAAPVCAGDAEPPIGTRAGRALAPIFLTEPLGLDGFYAAPLAALARRDGVNASVMLDETGVPVTTVLQRFGCAAPPDVVEGVRVRFGGLFAGVPGTVDLSMRPVVGGVPVGDPTSLSFSLTDTPVDHEADVVVDAALDLTPFDVCDPGFGVELAWRADAGYEVLFDWAGLEVTGADDCDDGDDARYAPAGVFADNDADGFGAGAAIATCVGDDEREALLRMRASDCDDGDDDARPDQTAYFTDPRSSGSYDYDCSGDEERAPITTSGPGCTLQGIGTCYSDPIVIEGDCGAEVTTQRCVRVDFQCIREDEPTPTVQACR